MPVLQWGMLCVLSLLLSIGFLAVHLPAALLLGPMIAGSSSVCAELLCNFPAPLFSPRRPFLAA